MSSINLLNNLLFYSPLLAYYSLTSFHFFFPVSFFPLLQSSPNFFISPRVFSTVLCCPFMYCVKSSSLLLILLSIFCSSIPSFHGGTYKGNSTSMLPYHSSSWCVILRGTCVGLSAASLGGVKSRCGDTCQVTLSWASVYLGVRRWHLRGFSCFASPLMVMGMVDGWKRENRCGVTGVADFIISRRIWRCWWC